MHSKFPSIVSSARTSRFSEITAIGYQMPWRGNSKILLWGRFLMGNPISKHAFIFYTFMGVQGFTYYIMLTEMAPVLARSQHGFLVFLSFVVGLFFSVQFVRTAFTDPGVILQNYEYDRVRLVMRQEEIEEYEQ